MTPILRWIHGKLRRVNGRVSTPPDAPRLFLSNFINAKALPTPAPFDWTPKVPISELGMDGNDNQGDCVAAYMSHLLTVLSTYGANAPLVATAAQTLATYHAIGGPGDNGLDPNVACQWWAKSPIMPGDKPILAFAVVDYRNQNLLMQAGDLFGGLGYSLNLPQNCFDALNANQPWTDTSEPPDPTMGHEMYIVKVNATGPVYVTWGQLQQASWAWHLKYGVDARIVISPWWLMGTPAGVDVATLLADYQAMTGQTPPNPGPIIPPIPVGPPTPVPVVGPTAAHVKAAVDAMFVQMEQQYARYYNCPQMLKIAAPKIDAAIDAAFA